ncbi:Trk system potassium uptake protein TrkA [Clostridium homopropionicum DSM 5847]|uniref:Trk system potassium uptake protein TrkA n=1 Tax=Clostridium homopropionicum DSM 5847 TaxID=1121318 RepID=A0A0L6Z5D6_9CLOT|nr:TrkA family potassium uptake protein [Clostridium homopropionicum]KOA18179.1 Trk system potassium uptake protein TrkA [Clostridium homopropionicum DSM 5847]SFF71810.1 TrkA-N domain-containing protein [Clostridium homopropionicum]
MYIVIIGCGRLGSSLAMDFSKEGHDVVIIDNDKDNLERLGSGFNGRRIKGVEIDNYTLIEAGIDYAEIFLAVTSDDNINIMACEIAKNIHRVKKVIARNVEPSREFIYRKLGIECISTVKIVGSEIKNIIHRDVK